MTCNAAAIRCCMVPYTFVIPNLDVLQMHDGVSIKKTITPHTVPFFLCRAFHPCTAENGVLIVKTKMSYCATQPEGSAAQPKLFCSSR